MKLRTALDGCASSQLSRIAAAWRLPLEAGTLRRELVELLATHMVEVAQGATTWDTLNARQRDVLQALVRADGRHEYALLVRRLARGAGAGDDDTSRVIESSVADLVERGVLFRVFDADEQRRGIYLVLPDEVLVAVRGHLGARAAPTPPVADVAPARDSETDLASDLFVLASALRREAWSAASRGLAGRRERSLSQILARLRLTEDDGPVDAGRRWRFLLWVAQRAGWIGRGTWPTPDEDAIERLLAAPGSLPARALAAGPVRADPRSAPASDVSGPRQRQADALQLLSELPNDQWFTVDDLVGWVAGELTDESASLAAERARAEANRLGGQLHRWLIGRWYWLGLVRWGWDGSGWSLVQPTDALRSLASGRWGVAAFDPTPCVVGERLTFEAPRDADLAALFRAERYLALEGGSDGARRYGLTPASFDRGIRLGGEPDELRSLLARLFRGAVPEAWSAAIEAWTTGQSRLALGAQLILTSEQSDALDEALQIPAARDGATERISPVHAAIAGEGVADLLAELARAGLPVDVDSGLRVEPSDAGRAAALADGVAETAWVALEVLRRLAPEVVGEQRDLQVARRRLDAVLAVRTLEALDRRAASIVAAIANRRRPGARGRVV